MLIRNGFTLIEFVLVLVTLGIVAAIAVPRFLDLSEDTGRAAVAAQANNLISNNAINLGACRLGSDDCVPFDTTGFGSTDWGGEGGVCQDALDELLPEAAERFEAKTFASSKSFDSVQQELDPPDEAFFYVTRTVQVEYPQTVPCGLRLKD